MGVFLRTFGCSLLLSTAAVAQLSNSGVKGTVHDSTNGIVPDAAVTLTNLGTQEHRQDRTNREGYFDFTALAPGEYEVQVQREGFADFVAKLTLRVAQNATVDAVLKVATTYASVDVVDATPIIERSEATIADVKEDVRIQTLPLANRNFLNVLNFTPGVVANGFGGQGNGYTRVNGIPGGSMDYLVDGQTASERVTNELQRTPQPLPTIQELKVTTSNGSAEYSRPGMVEVATKSGTNQLHGQLFELNRISALQAKTMGQTSVKSLVHNEFGGNLGGPVIIPKLYDGRNKTFFFVDVEAIRERSAANARYTVPQKNWKTGDFSNFVDSQGAPVIIYDPLTTHYDPALQSYVRSPFPGNRIPVERINPIAAKIMTYIPDPTSSAPYYLGPNYQVPNLRAKSDQTLITAKVDQLFGQQRLSVRYTHTDTASGGAGYFLNPRQGAQGGHNAAISYTHIFTPNIVNEARGGVQVFHAYSGPQIISPPITQTLGLPTYPGTIAWPSFYFDDAYSYNFDGIDRDNPKDSPNITVNVADNVSLTKGRHEMKTGFAFQHVMVETYETGQPGGDYNFSGLFTAQMDPKQAAKGIYNQQMADTGAGLADLLLGHTDYAGLNQYPVFDTRQSYFAGFFQDNWKVTPKLVLNLGLRYDYWTPFKDANGKASTLKFTAGSNKPVVVYPGSGTPNVDPAVLSAYQSAGLQFQSAQAAGFNSDLWNMEKNNWAPRFGIAYTLNEKTVLRGGYGIYYWAMPLIQYHQNTRKNAPFSYIYQSTVDNTDNNAAELAFPAAPSRYSNQSPNARTLGNQFINPTSLAIAENSGWNILPFDPNYKPQRVAQYNVTLERDLGKKTGVRLSYVGNNSSNLVMYDPINALVPRAQAPAGAKIQQRRAYPNFATSSTNAMDLMRYNGFANSNSAQAEVKQQVNADMILQGSFVYQRVLTTSEGSNNTFAGLEMLPSALTNNASDAQRLSSVYANDSSLPRYAISINTHYVLPFGKGKMFLNNTNGFVDRLVSGWNFTAFFYWRSGLYFSPYYSARGSATILAQGKNGALPKDQRTRKQWFDARVCRLDLGQTCTTQSYLQRANTLDNDLLNNIPRSTLTGPGFNNMDATFSKITPIKERLNLQLEAQVFNIYNHINMSIPNNQGVITSQVGGSRLIQLQGKIVF
ncbi:TonB-dependent receptor [Terriglobus albidus]|uniref:TonB-dependent receptor n=1 Tax=Terriglobus albidus TaxID=1592106 RepID=UPI0021DF8A77|nr:TonB-dependent receptor [Terriglobus albidus]